MHKPTVIKRFTVPLEPRGSDSLGRVPEVQRLGGSLQRALYYGLPKFVICQENRLFALTLKTEGRV